MQYPLGVTSQSLDITCVNDSGLELTGQVAVNFPTLSWSLAGPNADNTFPSLSDLSGETASWVAGGVYERGNGVYRLDVPDAMFATPGYVRLRGSQSGFHVLYPLIEVLAELGTGIGADTVTIAVTDINSNPIQGATVRVASGAQTYYATSDGAGQAVFNLNAATWTVSITAFGYSFTGANLTVAGATSQTYQLSMASITPSGSGFTTGYVTCYDQFGNLDAGVSITATLVTAGGVLGNAFNSTTVTQTSGSNGVCQFPNLALGAAYLFVRGTTGNPYTVVIPLLAGATYALPSIIGSP